MTEEVKRNYLEIKSLQDLKEGDKPSNDYFISLVRPINFQLNKFFYKSIGKKHKWIDRLSWTEEKWISYASSENVRTYVFKFKNDLVGFFELIFHHNKKLGSYLLSEAIKKSFENNVTRVWVHTCSLDHKNALSNYVSRGMKIFKTEILNI